MDAASHDILVTAVAAIAGGVFLLVIARRLDVPAIVLLLLGGAACGSQGLNVIRPDSFGNGFLVFVELSVGLILFEGGLTLSPEGYRAAPTMIKRLLTLGVLVTWLTTTLLLRFTVALPWRQAVVAGSLVIVTGPTVIAPLLKRVRVTHRLHSILKWEGVLIDPIGVFIAVLCFEWLSESTGQTALVNLAQRTTVGMVIGLAGGGLIMLTIRRRWVPADVVNVFTLASAILIFGVADALISKAGLLSVTVAGFTFGVSARGELKDVRRFKAEVTDLLIATLFMLLAARLRLDQFGDFGLSGLLAVAGVMFIVRPLCIAACAWGLDIPGRERAFLSWIAPRGIVAASMASLFALNLEARGVADARFVETFTYSVIVATIVLQGLTAGPLARVLQVQRPQPTGWLIVGAHALARRVASFIRDTTDASVVLVDTSAALVREAVQGGHRAVRADARELDFVDKHQLIDIGNVLAITDNEDLNARIAAIWSDIVGPDHVFRYSVRSQPAGDGERAAAGVNVWPSLPRPSVLASEMAHRTTQIIEIAEDVDRPPGATPLVLHDGRRIQLCTDESSGADPGPARGLYVRRDTDALRTSTRPELVMLIDEPLAAETVLRMLLDQLGDVCPPLGDDAMFEELMRRERVFPSVIGDGVAVPHAYSDDVAEQFCAIARLSESAGYPDADGAPVRLLFVVISPRSDPKGHLTLLADIARVLRNASVREALLEAGTPDGVLRAISNRPTAGAPGQPSG